MDEIEQFIVEHLRSRDLGETSEPLHATTKLMEKGVLDSLELMSLMHRLEEEYGIRVPAREYVPETFDTPRSIAAMVKRVRMAAA